MGIMLGNMSISNTYPGDSEAPVIGVLSSTGNTGTTVDLEWTAATDNIGVVGYELYVDGSLNITLGNVLSFTAIGLTDGNNYDFSIKAFDNGGNRSEFSNVVSVTPSDVVTGQAEYTTPGTYSWECPVGVTSVSVVAIGGGGGGMHYATSNSTYTYPMNGGAGGGLGWTNNITVVPGNSYTVTVGSGGASGKYSGTGSPGLTSLFINTTTVSGNGGIGGKYNSNANTTGFTGDGGGHGGGGTTTPSSNGPHGGGGAGGYSGNGGSSTTSAGNNGAGGGGASGDVENTHWSGGGGGTGLQGESTNGVYPGGGGSGGVDGIATGTGHGGLYGGGGGGSSSIYNGTGGNGGSGAVRIIWGLNRTFPSTNTADV